VIGLYGLISYNVSQQRREIGVRMALGATEGGIVGSVLGASARLAFIGAAIGLVGAFGATRLLTGLLYGVSPVECVHVCNDCGSCRLRWRSSQHWIPQCVAARTVTADGAAGVEVVLPRARLTPARARGFIVAASISARTYMWKRIGRPIKPVWPFDRVPFRIQRKVLEVLSVLQRRAHWSRPTRLPRSILTTEAVSDGNQMV